MIGWPVFEWTEKGEVIAYRARKKAEIDKKRGNEYRV
jgi:hypothetical protein